MKHGYKIVFKQPIELSRTPTIRSGYANQHKQKFLLECVQEMLQKKLKVVLLAIKSFQTHLVNKRVLVASDNATVVSYLNKQGNSLEMCLMIWCLMAFCNPRAILLRAHHIQGCLNVIADSLSCSEKIIQTEWSLHPKVFHMICQIWHRPMVDMFATKINNKLPFYVS